MVGFSNCCSSSSRPMPDSRRYATISLLSRMGNEYACTMVIGDRHKTGGLTTTKPQNPTNTQNQWNPNSQKHTQRTTAIPTATRMQNPSARAAPRLQPTTLERSRGGKQIFSNQWWTGFDYTRRFLYSQRVQRIRFSFSFSFWMDAWAGYQKNSSKAVLSDPVLIDLITVRYPQPVLVNNLHPKKIRIAFLN